MNEARRERTPAGAVAVFVALALGACDDPAGLACTAEAVFGISVTVLDGSGAPAAEGAEGTLVDGTYEETLAVLGPSSMAGAVERPGTYDVAVAKAGYRTWSAQNITVTAGECHVTPVTLEANLVRVP